MKYFRKYNTVKEALDFEIEHNDFVITGWPFIPAVQISNTSFERHHVHTKVGPSFNAGYFTDDFTTSENYGRKVYLPTDWTLLNYIENTVANGGYINTGYTPSMTSTDSLTTLDFDITFSITTLPESGSTSTIFSIGGLSCTIDSNGYITFASATLSTALETNTKYTVHIHWAATSSGSTSGDVSMSIFDVTNLTSTDKFVGEVTSTAQTLTSAELVLFNATTGLVGRMYYFGVYEDNDIKLDMVPVVGQDNMAGMYNIRNAEFMGNSRTITGPMYMTRNVSDLVASTGEYAKVDTLYGNSIVWNQIIQTPTYNVTTSVAYGAQYYADVTSIPVSGIQVFLFTLDLANVPSSFTKIFNAMTNSSGSYIEGTWTRNGNHFTYIIKGGGLSRRIYIRICDANTGVQYQVKNLKLHNLTQMFGTDDQIAAALGVTTAQLYTQTAVDAFKRMFPADYYPYNTGEVLNVNATGIKATDSVLGTHEVDLSVNHSSRMDCVQWGISGTRCPLRRWLKDTFV